MSQLKPFDISLKKNYRFSYAELRLEEPAANRSRVSSFLAISRTAQHPDILRDF
jgi:hypothetical protein